jgi:hypothetical protein
VSSTDLINKVGGDAQFMKWPMPTAISSVLLPGFVCSDGGSERKEALISTGSRIGGNASSNPSAARLCYFLLAKTRNYNNLSSRISALIINIYIT